jgi:hypothetical protein
MYLIRGLRDSSYLGVPGGILKDTMDGTPASEFPASRHLR